MILDRAVMMFAGFAMLLGIVVSLTINQWWLALSASAALPVAAAPDADVTADQLARLIGRC